MLASLVCLYVSGCSRIEKRLERNIAITSVYHVAHPDIHHKYTQRGESALG